MQSQLFEHDWSVNEAILDVLFHLKESQRRKQNVPTISIMRDAVQQIYQNPDAQIIIQAGGWEQADPLVVQRFLETYSISDALRARLREYESTAEVEDMTYAGRNMLALYLWATRVKRQTKSKLAGRRNYQGPSLIWLRIATGQLTRRPKPITDQEIQKEQSELEKRLAQVGIVTKKYGSLHDAVDSWYQQRSEVNQTQGQRIIGKVLADTFSDFGANIKRKKRPKSGSIQEKLHYTHRALGALLAHARSIIQYSKIPHTNPYGVKSFMSWIDHGPTITTEFLQDVSNMYQRTDAFPTHLGRAFTYQVPSNWKIHNGKLIIKQKKPKRADLIYTTLRSVALPEIFFWFEMIRSSTIVQPEARIRSVLSPTHVLEEAFCRNPLTTVYGNKKPRRMYGPHVRVMQQVYKVLDMVAADIGIKNIASQEEAQAYAKQRFALPHAISAKLQPIWSMPKLQRQVLLPVYHQVATMLESRYRQKDPAQIKEAYLSITKPEDIESLLYTQ